MEEGYDEELEKLLGEIPRATSAPPHLEELQTAHDHHHHHHHHHQHSSNQVSHDKDTPSDEANIMQTLSHHSLLYTPFSEPLQTSPPMSTHAYEDPPPSSNPLSPFYGGLPPASHDISNLEMPKEHAIPQARNSVGFNLSYNGGLSRISSDYITQHGQVMFSGGNQEMKSTWQDETQGYAEQGRVEMSNGSISSGGHLVAAPHLNTMGAVSSASEPSFATSCLPSSLQLLDSFAHNASECLGKELHTELDKLALAKNGLALKDRSMAQPSRMRFVHPMRSPLEVQKARQLSEQSIALLEPAVATMTDTATMQLGSQHSRANGAFLLPPSGSFMPPYPSDMKMVYAQRMHEAAAAAAQQQQQIEERVLCRQRIKEEFLLRQQKLQEQQARFYASLQSQPGPAYSRCHSGMQYNHPPHNSTCTFDVLQQEPTSKATLLGAIMPERNRPTAGTWASPVMLSGEIPEASGICRYFLHGFCTRGDMCPFSHSCLQSNNVSASNDSILLENSSTFKGPRNGLISQTAVMPVVKKKNQLANGHGHGQNLSNGTHLSSPNLLSSMSGGGKWKEMDSETVQSVNSQIPVQQPPLPPKYTTLKEVEGHIYGIAKDQHGCRFLQRKFEEGVSEDVQKIFVEIIDHVVELMTDPFGNYLVQKLLEVCNEEQRMEILYKVTGKDQLVTISLNMHGTRAVQKLIETLSSAEQVRLVVASLKQGVVTLIKDLNGNHVVQRCLQRLSMDDSQFIFDAAAYHCVEIATHRHGCCVLQRCVDFSSGQQRTRLVAEIAANALVLSQDPFGNYVVQYILDLGLTWAIVEVVARLEGNYVHLAMQKFSSNVVEKCLKLAGEESKAQIIRELMSSARLAQLLQDPFANYVVQSALMVSKGALHFGLVEAIRPHLPALRSSPYGKRILSRTSLKK